MQRLILIVAVYFQLAAPDEVLTLGDLYERFQALHDAPPIQDVGRLPPKFVADHHAAFSQKHLDWVEARWIMDPEYADWLADQRVRREFWMNVQWARMEHISIKSRREALKMIQLIVGTHDYIHRNWPDPAPFWRFEK